MKNILLSLLILLGSSVIVAAQDVSAYLKGDYVDVKKARKALKSVGYEVLASYSPVKNGYTLVFTNDNLKAQGAKKGRANASILRLFVDNQEKMISITNPMYFGRAFMQDEYVESVFSVEFEKLSGLFKGLKGSKDKLDTDDIGNFHFMMGMPYYEDPDILGKGNNADLLKKMRTYKNGKGIIFELKLSDTSTLVAYDLGKRTKKFVKKIGRANAAVLPYTVSIEDGRASALAAKYYLAVSYPLLTMGEFMTISSVPGAILKDLKKPFKK